MLFVKTVPRALSRLGLDQRGGAPFPRQPAPMLLEKADALFPSPDWIYEPKWDGFRVLAAIRDGSVRLVSRNGHSFTNLFGPVSDALRGFPASILLDGEVIAINSPISKRCRRDSGPETANSQVISATWSSIACT